MPHSAGTWKHDPVQRLVEGVVNLHNFSPDSLASSLLLKGALQPDHTGTTGASKDHWAPISYDFCVT